MPLLSFTYASCRSALSQTESCRSAGMLVLRRFLSSSSAQIPSPKGLPLIGTTLAIMASGGGTNLHKYVDRRHRELGPFYKEKMGPVTAYFVSDPEEMRAVFAQEGKHPMHVLPEAWTLYNKIYGCSRGLFFMDGDNWWHHRRIMNMLLLKGNLNYVDQACDLVSESFIKNLDTVPEANLEATLYKWSLENIIAVLIGAATYKNNAKDLQNDIDHLASIVHLVFKTTDELTLIPAPIAHKLNIKAWRNFVSAVTDALNSTNAFVGRLIAISNQTQEDSENSPLLPKMLREDIRQEDVAKIIADLILAAGDTTAYAMEWMLYLAASHPKLQRELRTGKISSKNFLKESLRLYPVAPFLTRILPEETKICGFTIPKMSLVVMSIYTSGRDSAYFHEPFEFRPSRWDRSDQYYKPVMQKASLPFALGLRSCIGRKIAETQLTMTLDKVINNFDVILCNEKPIKMVMKMVAVPSEPVRLKFRPLWS